MSAIANQLLGNNGLTDQNQTTLGTNLMIFWYDIASLYGSGKINPRYHEPWENEYIWNSFSNFLNSILSLPYTIVNEELSKQVSNMSANPDIHYLMNFQTGYAPLTFYVTSPSTVQTKS